MSRKLAILDFDIECLPGHWIGGDYVSKIITAVAWSYGGDVTVLTHYDYDIGVMADWLAQVVEAADIVTGHYIRGFDLPLLNGALLQSRQLPLPRVMTSDTKLDLLKAHGRSLSQENLAAQLGVSAPKVKVSLPDWEGFNTRRPGYKDAGVERVRGDVIQHMELRYKLIKLGWLGPPTAWNPTGKKSPGYRP